MDDKQGLRAIHLFAGSGGGTLGGLLCGWRTVCAVELDEYCREVLVSRQNDGSLEPFPIWDDVCTFDGRPWKGHVDVVAGGFPCTDISPLGRRAGINGEKSGLWKEMARIVGEVRPTWVFAENSSELVRLGLDVVLQDLDSLGYDAEWECLSAAELGAPHIRDRVWVLGKSRSSDLGRGTKGAVHEDRRAGAYELHRPSAEGLRVLSDAYLLRRQEQGYAVSAEEIVHPAQLQGEDVYLTGGIVRSFRQPNLWPNKPSVVRVVDGPATQVEQLRALGNAQLPVVAARAFLDLAPRFA